MCPIASARSPLRGIGVAVGAMCPIRPNVVWALDFQFDQTTDGRMLKLLNVIDEFTREALAIDVDRSIDADGVVALPRPPGRRAWRTGLRALRPRPRVHRLRRGRLVPLQRHRHGLHRPGLAVAERLDRVVQRPAARRAPERPALRHASSRPRSSLEDWRIDYNINRPHSAHGWLTPVEFVEDWLNRQAHQLA